MFALLLMIAGAFVQAYGWSHPRAGAFVLVGYALMFVGLALLCTESERIRRKRVKR